MKSDPPAPASNMGNNDGIQEDAGKPATAHDGSEPSVLPEEAGRRRKPAPVFHKPVERLFPFVLRAGLVITGRDHLRRQRRRLQFILLSTDISENSRREILNDFPELAVVCRFSTAEIEQHFHFRNTKAIGFKKSPLAMSIWREFRATTPAEDIKLAVISNTKKPAVPQKTPAITKPDPTVKPEQNRGSLR